MRGRLVAIGAFGVIAIGAVAGGIACESVIGADFGSQHLSVCTPVMPPSSTTIGDTGTGTTLTFVVSSVDWGENDDANGRPRALSIGYDLDGRCTSQYDPPLCEPAAWTGVTVTDGPNGIDNAVGMLLHDQASTFGTQEFTSPKQTMALANGTEAPPAMFRLSDYSGGSDDGVVTVEWIVPVALGAPAKGDGHDVYMVAPGTADASDGGAVVSHYVDHAAFIQSSQLVAHFPAGPPIVIADVPVSTTTAEMTAQIVEGGGGSYALHDGIMAGLGPMSDLFDDLSALSSTFVSGPTKPDAAPGFAVCRNTVTIYPKIKQWLCSHADSTSGGPVCDTASFGVAFDTTPAVVGTLAPSFPPPMYCATGEDPAGDSCAAPP